MPNSWRLVRPVVMVALLASLVVALIAPATAVAQEEAAPVLIQGTPELEKLVGDIRDAYVAANPEAEVTIDPAVGLRGAFTALCAGENDIVMSTEAISDAQIAACNAKGQNFVEVVLAYEAVVLLAPERAELTCASQTALESALQLGAPDDVLWGGLGSQAMDTRVEFVGPLDTDPAYMLLAKSVPAEALRENIEKTGELANIVARVTAGESNALGFMSLAHYDALKAVAEADAAAPVVLGVQNVDGVCNGPSMGALEDRLYPYARTDYLYVNAESAAREDVQAFVEFAMSDAGVVAFGADNSVTVPAADTLADSVANAVEGKVGRTFTRPLSPVNVSLAEAGTVQVGGSAALYDVTRVIINNFKREFANATVETELLGNAAGWNSFCSGAVDVMLASRAMTDEEAKLCQTAGIEVVTIDLGYQALALAVPQENDWATCVNADQVAGLLGAGTEEAPAAALWSDVDSEWPENALLVVAPPTSNGEVDYIVNNLLGDLTFALRGDVVVNRDPLYRLQGVANTASDETNPANGLTFAWWRDLADSTAPVTLLEVDAGEGCVAPSPETFADGSYALSNPMRIVVSKASFDNLLVQSFLWNLISEDSVAQYARYGYEGLDVALIEGAQKDALFELLASWTPPVTLEAESGEDAAATEEAAPEEAATEEQATEEGASE